MKGLEEKIKTFPKRPGVYLMKDKQGRVIYVGKALDLRSRVRSYFGRPADERYRVQFLMRRVSDIEYVLTDTEKEALILENTLIKTHQPRYNVSLRDDKTYVSLRLNIKDKWPRLTITRRVRDDGALYFGPYSSASDVRNTIRFVKKTFRLRSCTDSFFRGRESPCIEYQIHQCVAPCVDYIDKEGYRALVNQLILFLNGKNEELIADLEAQMEAASQKMEYEEAAKLRDRIGAIRSTLESQKVVSHKFEDRDVVGFFVTEKDMAITIFVIRGGILKETRNFSFRDIVGEVEDALQDFVLQYYDRTSRIPPEILFSISLGKRRQTLEEILKGICSMRIRLQVPSRGGKAKLVALANKNAEEYYLQAFSKDVARDRALVELRRRIGLKEIPSRIECYDISNIGGKAAVGSLVVFEDGIPRKDQYRQFNIRGLETSDDYGMLREVLGRRFAKEGWPEPDLVVVDGGKGQLNVALEVFKDLKIKGIPAIAIAKERDKKPDRVFLPGRKNPVIFHSGSPSLLLLQHLRDESHRFGIGRHRRRREKDIIKSELDKIPGIGPATCKKLLTHFGSVEKIKKATVSELREVKGLGKKQADKIFSSFK